MQQSHSWCIYPEENKNCSLKRYMHSSAVAALFVTAKTWVQPKFPTRIPSRQLASEECFSAINEWSIPICININEPREYYTQWSHSDRKRRILYDITYMWNLKNNTNESIYKTETHIRRKQLMATKEEREGSRDELGVWD